MLSQVSAPGWFEQHVVVRPWIRARLVGRARAACLAQPPVRDRRGGEHVLAIRGRGSRRSGRDSAPACEQSERGHGKREGDCPTQSVSSSQPSPFAAELSSVCTTARPRPPWRARSAYGYRRNRAAKTIILPSPNQTTPINLFRTFFLLHFSRRSSRKVHGIETSLAP